MKLVEQARRLLPGVRLLNTYSISECGEVAAVDIAEFGTDVPRFCPVGRVAGYAQALLIDTEGREVKDAGELLVCGPGVGTGYIGQEKLTRERFIQREGRVYYRTGDRAQLLPSGMIQIIGRCDYMVKIRGYSVVLPTIESAVLKAISVSACVVSVHGDEGGDKRIVGYIVPTTEQGRSNVRRASNTG